MEQATAVGHFSDSKDDLSFANRFAAINPDTSLKRIGVYNPWGAYVSVLTMLSATLKEEIDALIESGRVPTAGPPRFNNASLDAQVLRGVLGPNFSVSSTAVDVLPDSIRTTSNFDRHGEAVVVSVNVFSDFEQPIDSLISHLAGFQIRPLAAAINTGDPQLGSYSFHTKTGAFWLRGNMLIRMDSFTEDPAVDRLDLNLAANLDAHLGQDQIIPTLPDFAFAPHTLPDRLRRGDTLRLRLTTDTNSLAATMSFSSNLDVLVPRGVPDEGGHFVFYARSAGTAKVTVVGAAKENFRPLNISCDVTVEDTGEHDLGGPIIGEDLQDSSTLLNPPAWPRE